VGRGFGRVGNETHAARIRSWVRENELAGDGKSVWRGVGGERGEEIEEENICDFIF